MKKITVLIMLFFLIENIDGQINVQKYLDSLNSSLDIIYVEDIRVNNYNIYIGEKYKVFNETEVIKYIGPFLKKNNGYNQLDDYKTIELVYEDALIRYGEFDYIIFDGFKIQGKSNIRIEPNNLFVGMDIELLKNVLPKTYSSITKNNSLDSEQYYIINSQNKKKVLTGSLILYVAKKKISKIEYKY